MTPRLVVHADWSANGPGRWLVRARRGSDGRYRVEAPEPAGDAATLLARLAADGPALAGFDFPIGLPEPYARLRRIADFRGFLRDTGEAAWDRFRLPVAPPAEPSPDRPFYPARPGGASRDAFARGLGLAFGDLVRRCDKPAGAAMLFWTLGASQCGRAALAGWHELLRPALRAGADVALWPFDGDLGQLVDRHAVTVAEAYPGLCIRRLLGPQPRWSKLCRDDRARLGVQLLDLLPGLGAGATPALQETAEAGFDSDHAFDALAGLVGLVATVRGRWPDTAPTDPTVRKIEGWLIGLDAPDDTRQPQP